MRWIVFFLLIMNALMYAWFSFERQSEVAEAKSSAEAFDFSKTTSLTLTSEMPAAELKARDTRKVVVETPKSEPMCVVIGSFPEMVSAKQVAGRLVGHGINATVVLMEHEFPPVHWVYIEPAENREENVAILKKLQAKRVDSFLVNDGEYAGAISLGYFTKIESARSVMEPQIKAGYKARAMLKARTENAYFLALNVVDSVKFSTDLLENIQLENKAAKKQEKECKVLATLQTVQ